MKRKNASLWRQTTNQQRIVVAAAVAALVHLILILGINFSVFPNIRPAPVLSLNVSLIERISGELNAAPGGTLIPVTPGPPDIVVLEQRITSQQPIQHEPTLSSAALPAMTSQSTSVLTINDSASEIQSSPSSEKFPSNIARPSVNRSVMPRLENAQVTSSDVMDMTETDLHLAHLEVIPHKITTSPREKYIEVFDTSTLEGFYAENWRLKVEQIGTLYFPMEARERNLVGKLTLDVVIRFDGTIHSVNLLKSSGYDVLDRSARRIVYLAGPFEPFPESLKRHYDLLHIVRTWEFDQDDRLNSR